MSALAARRLIIWRTWLADSGPPWSVQKSLFRPLMLSLARGQVYSDSRSIQDASAAVVSAVQQACGTLAARAGLNPSYEPPAPPQLVEAGVRSDECLRAHGLPNVQDPTAQTPYTPGHGFGFTAGEMPAGGKADPAYQAAAHACRALLDAEIRASTLASLSNDG